MLYNYVFNGKASSAKDIVEQVGCVLEIRLGCLVEKQLKCGRREEDLRWKPPDSFSLKLNIDATISYKKSCLGLGAAIRDAVGNAMGGMAVE